MDTSALVKPKFSLNIPSPKSKAVSTLKQEPMDLPNESLIKDAEVQGSPNFRLMDITLPKTTLLGVQQAKRRLHAFSLMRNTLPVSPLLKKSPKQTKVFTKTEEAYDENGKKIEEQVVVKKPGKKGEYKTKKLVFNIVFPFYNQMTA